MSSAKNSPNFQSVLPESGDIKKEIREAKSKFEELEKRRLKSEKEIEKLHANQRQLFDTSLNKYTKKGVRKP